MARLVWGLMGDSRGHLTRAQIMAGELSGHEILFVGGGCVDELRGFGHRVFNVPMPGTILKNNRVSSLATAALFLRLALGKGQVLQRLASEIEAFKPDLAVSDYEYFLPHAARMMGLPSLSFGHQHVLTLCSGTLPPGQVVNRLLTTSSIRQLFSVPERYLITSFFPAKARGRNTTVLPPVLRPDVTRLSSWKGEHVLAYLRAGMPSELLAALASTGREIRVYGQGARESEGVVSFLPSSRGQFLKDLAGCAYVVSSGGHNLISEALCLGKPVLAVPVTLFYEQYVNAWHLRALGFGDFFIGGTEARRAIASFEAQLGARSKTILADSPQNGNRLAAQCIENILAAGF